MNLREKIKELADARGTTFSKIERRCGLGNGSIRQWTDGRYPSSDRLYRVALFLDTTVDEIMAETYAKGDFDDNRS